MSARPAFLRPFVLSARPSSSSAVIAIPKRTGPFSLDLERSGVHFRLVHIPPDKPPRNVDVLLHGHTHVPRNERRGDVLFLNPGCVTRPNRGAPASVAYLEIAADGKIAWRLVPLR